MISENVDMCCCDSSIKEALDSCWLSSLRITLLVVKTGFVSFSWTTIGASLAFFFRFVFPKRDDIVLS